VLYLVLPLGARRGHRPYRQLRYIGSLKNQGQTLSLSQALIDYLENRSCAADAHLEGVLLMSRINQSGTFRLGDRVVQRVGYGAMQLAGPGVFGPPKNRDAALAVLREAIASGVNHIDTSDYYGPHVTNQLIREALAPYRDDLVIVTKLDADGRRAGVAAAPLAQHPVDPRHLVGRASSREYGRRSVNAVAANLGGVGQHRLMTI
jgi:hypothetical protein